jgi:hypothetical protein
MELPIQPEQRLWLAVIAQAVKDAMHHDERREQVISWTATRDYIEICYAAGICPVMLRKAICRSGGGGEITL